MIASPDGGTVGLLARSGAVLSSHHTRDLQIIALTVCLSPFTWVNFRNLIATLKSVSARGRIVHFLKP